MSRNRNFLATLGLVVATATPAAAIVLPTSCTTTQPVGGGTNNNWTITVEEGPCVVHCYDEGFSCNPEGSCTGIVYSITQNLSRTADHVSTVVPADVTVVYPTDLVAAPCAGDALTLQGKNTCHLKAVRLSDETATTEVTLIVSGKKEGIPSSIAIRNGSRTEACAIVGLGGDPIFDTTSCVPTCGGFHAKQELVRSEIVQFGDCAVEFVFNTLTGAVVSASLTDDSPTGEEGCSFSEKDISAASLLIDGVPHGLGQFGDGYISTGSESCTSRMIAGRMYTWGRPCP